MKGESLVIIGYSGHAFVMCDIILSNGKSILGYCEQEKKKLNPYSLDYLGKERQFSFRDHKVVIGIGDNKIREKVYKSIESKVKFASAIHKSAIIGFDVELAQAVSICANVTINPLAKLSTGVICNTGSIIEHECNIGAFAHIAPGAVLAGNVSIGVRSFVGANAVIKQGVQVGSDVIIGAGSVIIKDVPSGKTVVGNPGRIL